jgi:hypothetical protein
MADRATAISLIDTDPVLRCTLEATLRRAGFEVTAVSRVADLERWPSGAIVIIESGQLTTWWRDVGATDVVVLTTGTEDLCELRHRGATTWMPRRLLHALILRLRLGTAHHPA